MAKKIEYKNAKAIIYDLIKKKKTDEFIIEKTLELFPDSLVDNKHCTKYRRELFVAGEIDASLAAVRSQDHQVWAQDNMTAAKRGVHKIYWKARATIEKAVEEAKKKLKVAKKTKATMSDQFFNCVLRGVKTKVKFSRLSKFIPLYGISVETPKGQAATTANYDRKW